MSTSSNLISELTKDYRNLHHERNVLLSFDDYLELVRNNPRTFIRSSAEYIRDTFKYFGFQAVEDGKERKYLRFKIFDIGTVRVGPIIGGEAIQTEIFNILESFVRQGMSNKLILLHGPNGSAKSSTIEAVSSAMQNYSETEEGAVYRFNWIFPTEKSSTPRVKGEVGPLGFNTALKDQEEALGHSYALIEESQIASKICSEFKENPLYLIPVKQRESWLRTWIGAKEGISPEKVELPPHILLSCLSKKNQLIMENLLNAYDGNLSKMLRHIQVERFFYSKQYRVGISCIEPQMSIDAREKLLTMDKNIANLPPILHNIRFTEAEGELIEANRGLLEFSDFLKRPLETFKYLLSTVETATVNLPTATADLDIVFFGTTNEQQLDAFKNNPDFSSFRSRFELLTTPYLLRTSQERLIYERDLKSLEKIKRVCPHTLDMLCLWAIMTRLKQPDIEKYDANERDLMRRLDPRLKVKVYEHESLDHPFTQQEEVMFKDLRDKILCESQGMIFYEGRIGASPRELKVILHRAAQNPNHATVTPMAIFEELEKLVKEKTIYEFLQIEPRAQYYDAEGFIQIIKNEFTEIFENEVISSMTLVEQKQYDILLSRYIENIVADIKREKLYNQKTRSYDPPNQSVMMDVENILGVDQEKQNDHRQNLLSRIAAYKLERPSAEIDVRIIFKDILDKISEHYYEEKRRQIEEYFRAMLALDTDVEKDVPGKDLHTAKETYRALETRYKYDKLSARNCLKFLVEHRKTKI